jgi:hypothetical protein
MIDPRGIAAIFERFTSGYHFYLEDLRSSESVEIGERAAWPIGSCFKLAVLIAYFEALVDGSLPPDSLDAETRIPPERFSTGGGVVNLLDTPLSLTDRQMLRLMIAASDGTATDVLIDKLGLERVQATLSRAAPDSTLACGLNEMVRLFWEIPGALDCKTRDWGRDEARVFRDATARLGATHAVDLARLALTAFYPRPPATHRAFLEACYPLRVWPRTSMFLGETCQMFTKTGSLGQRYFTQDCGVIRLPGSDQPAAIFGYCTEGFRLPSMMVDVAMGMLGLEVAKALGLAAKPNADFTLEGAELLLGDLWPG